MKKIFLLLAAVVLVTGISLAYAQTGTQSSQKSGCAAHEKQMGNRQGGLPKLLGELNLTEDQKAKIKSILDEHRPNINGGNKNTGPLAQRNLTEEQKTKIAEIRNQIDAVLTPEQRAKLEQLRKEAQARMEERRKKQGSCGN